MARPILRRIASTFAVLAAVSVVIFAAVELLPGDAATRILGQNATPERLEALREQLGLDRSAVSRYFSWIGGVLTGDLGTAATTDRTVWDTIATPLRNTAILASIAFVTISAVAVAGGLLAGRKPGSRTDRTLSTAALGAVAVPDFVIGGLLMSVFAFGLGWVSSVSLVPLGGSPLDRPGILILPVATATATGGMFGLRLVRAVVAEASARPYVESARLAGVAERTVLVKHLLPSVLGPIAQVLALLVPFLIGGTVVIERVFAYPGFGSLLVAQINARDVTVVSAMGLIMSAAVIVSFLFADLLSGPGRLPGPQRFARLRRVRVRS